MNSLLSSNHFDSFHSSKIINNPTNESTIVNKLKSSNDEELKLIDNCLFRIKPNNVNDKNNINSIYNMEKSENNKASIINNSFLNKIFKNKNPGDSSKPSNLKILQNFSHIDEKIRLGYINVVPKSSLLYINEEKFLSYKEIKKELEKKELDSTKKLKSSCCKSLKNMTPFQNFELTKNLLKEKIKFKKDINYYQQMLFRDTIDKENNKIKFVQPLPSPKNNERLPQSTKIIQLENKYTVENIIEKASNPTKRNRIRLPSLFNSDQGNSHKISSFNADKIKQLGLYQETRDLSTKNFNYSSSKEKEIKQISYNNQAMKEIRETKETFNINEEKNIKNNKSSASIKKKKIRSGKESFKHNNESSKLEDNSSLNKNETLNNSSRKKISSYLKFLNKSNNKPTHNRNSNVNLLSKKNSSFSDRSLFLNNDLNMSCLSNELSQPKAFGNKDKIYNIDQEKNQNTNLYLEKDTFSQSKSNYKNIRFFIIFILNKK